MGIELVIGSAESFRPADDYFGALLQYPGVNGDVRDYTSLIEACHQHEVWVTLAADIMSLAMLKTPGEMGAGVPWVTHSVSVCRWVWRATRCIFRYQR